MFGFFSRAESNTPEFKIPDFSLPRTVIKDASAVLDKADAMPDSGPVRLRAILEILTAQCAIDADSAFAQPAFIEEQLAKGTLDDATKAMFLTLEADVFNKIYTRDQYAYNRVDAPLEPYPADISEWSGEQLRTRIIALLDSAVALADGNTPLSKFDVALDYSPQALSYIPTVKAFAQYKKFDALSRFSRSSGIDYKRQASALAQRLIEENPAPSAPYFYWVAAKNTLDHKDGKPLIEIYKKYAGYEPARYLLTAANSYLSKLSASGIVYSVEFDVAAATELCGILRQSLAQFPDWYDNNRLKNALNELTLPLAEISVPSTVAPGSSFDIKLKWANADSIDIAVYALTPTFTNYRSKAVKASMQRVDIKSLYPASTYGTSEYSFTLPSPGRYAVLTTVNGKYSSEDCSIIDASPIYPFVVNGCTDYAVGVADFITGKPVKDAKVLVGDKKTAKKTLGVTDGDGLLIGKAPQNNGWRGQVLGFKYQNYIYGSNRDLYLNNFHQQRDFNPQTSVVIYTDRPIYHPGDTINWAAVAALTNSYGEGQKLAEGYEFDVEIDNANGEKVDSVRATADGLGRISGAFATQKGTLTGYYTIHVKDKLSKSGAESFVMVSDYKAPVFEASINSVERDLPAKGDVTIKGSARTYSGMPVAGAKVEVLIQGAMRWRWFVPQTTLGTVETTTDADGNFTVVVPETLLESELADGDKPYTDFTASLTVTSGTAETATASRSFTTGKPYSLALDTPEAVNIDKPFTFTVKAYDANSKEAPIALSWSLASKDDSKVLREGKANAGTAVELDLSGLPMADYILSVEPADSTLAKSIKSNPIALYSIEGRKLAASLPFMFIPDTKVRPEGGKLSVQIGTNADAIYVYSFVRCDSTLQKSDVHRVKRGFSKIKIELPDGFNAADAQVVLLAVRQGKLLESTLTIEKEAAEKVEIIAESFRDRLLPGASETWRFRLAKGSEGIADAGFIATMYDKALDDLYSMQWPSHFNFYSRRYGLGLSYNGIYDVHGGARGLLERLKTSAVQWPAFRFYGNYRLTSGGMYYARGLKMSVTSASNAAVTDLLIVEDDSVEREELAAPEAAADAADGGARESQIEYREGDVPLAFWRPSLVTDAEGNVDLVFTVPNANTTWQLRTVAWSRELDVATFAAQAMANKPVMVQPNVPRFLRQGDKAQVLATVFNNSDDTQAVTATAEIFDLATGAVLSAVTRTDTLASKASATIGINVEAPVDASAIGYRVRAVAGNFADGEQAAIPVLSSAAAIIESTDFYLNPGENKPFEFTLDATDDATLTLQYCQNPTWTIVKAMRGLAATESLSSTGLAGQLFSALTARHLLATNPQIAEAIAAWRDNPGEEALKSMLEKNETLKQLMLEQTPWVQAAKSQTQRMAALADLLDSARAEKAIADAKAALAKLQKPDGGFAWGSWSRESSVWATSTVLTTMGIARSLGMLDDSFDALLQPAFAYLQAKAVEAKVSTDHDLALIAAYFPSYKQSVAGGKIIRATVADIAANWKKNTTVDKAYAVYILNSSGRPTEAAKVLASIRQFAVEQPGKGLCFPNVSDIRAYATIIQAYAAMKAPDAELDALRQWIIVRAQALDDLGAYNPDYVIAAIMLTGSDWTSAPVDNLVKVNGKALAIDKVESSTGYFAQTLPAMDGKLTVTVRPNGVTPSYGSVTSLFKRTATEVEARPGTDLAIEKHFLVENDGKWVETKTFALGQRVRIQLTLKVKRDLEYVSIADERAATFEPVDQLPGYVWDAQLAFYRENLDASTRLFISWLPKGTYHITYDMTAAAAGTFSSGIATLQSQYAPELTAHSAGCMVEVR